MALHHRLQPHHHVAAWAVCALLVVLAAALASRATESSAQGTEPSQSTKQFFGADDEKEDQFTEPAECQQQQTEANAAQQKAEALNAEMQQVSNELNGYRSRDPNSLTDEDKAKIASLESRLQAIQAEMQTMQRQQTSQPAGPSESCRKAIVAMMIAHMEKFAGKFDSKFFPVLNRVDAVVKKIESAIPNLKESGVGQTDISAIEKEIATIKKSTAALREFFTFMKGKINDFVAKARSDPANAFTVMESMNSDQSRFSAAAKAADDMVAAFDRLEKTVEKIAPST